MSFHDNPRIVTDSLVLMLDAANPKSYPGSGTLWNDISGNGRHATLSAESIGTAAPGHMTIAASQYISIPWGNGINPSSQEYTLICFLKASQTVSGAMWLDHGSNGTSQRFYSSLNGLGAQASGWADSTPNDINWHMNHIICNGLGNVSLYQDAEWLQASKAVTSYTVPSNFELGGRLTAYTFPGNIDYFVVYDRVLTSPELQQNFDALKGRFGL